jgi:hypothetical protein
VEDPAEEEGGGGQKAPGGLKGIRLDLLVPGCQAGGQYLLINTFQLFH